MKRKWLIAISFLAVILVGITGCQGVPDEARSQETALKFLENEPTYKFDGVGGSIGGIKLVRTEAISKDAWVFIYEFDCLYPGYGDRSGFPLYKEEITTHTAKIVVINGKVNNAWIDDVWDMHRQAYVPA